MGFRAQLDKDAATFLNPEEFGDALLIDGITCSGSWEPVDQDQGAQPGYYADHRRYFITPGPLPLPVLSQQLEIDGHLWSVDRAHQDHGIMEIEVSRFVS